MSELFLAYSGEVLTVSAKTDAIIARLFQYLDRPSCYRAADAWLLNCPKSRWPRNHQRFLINWAKREQSCTLRNVESWRKKQEATERELAVGYYSYDTSPKEK